MADLTPTKPGYYWAQWRKAVAGTRDAAELTPSDDWEPVQVFENALDDRKHPSSHAGERRARDVELSYDAGVRVQAAC
ncbi:hypothetical protein IG197_27480 [Aminobacter sp. SR38]|uniref:hypothetical protein n=1 Tax=Aminobacter sp. SR38 TaxID=2774562 RepID=UPI00177A9795|nr:hypothetical protein [Aminobacter sp. SR38]QOF71442.1 hypothetical protein IG197_27480 [Aminobacter sp. SR38]